MLFTISEIIYIAITILALGFIFSNQFRKPRYEIEEYLKSGHEKLWEDMMYASLIVAPAVILHEFAHKFAALSFGFSATYFASLWGLGIGIMLRLFNSAFIFFVPGYVSISGIGTSLQFALTAIAGPLTNLIIFAVCFLLLKYANLPEKYLPIVYLSKQINLWLFIFNMLPFPGFDGFQFLMGLLRAF
jgi:Zn-dependent protease